METGDLTELGHRMTKEDKSEEQMGVLKREGLMYTYLKCWERGGMQVGGML